MPCFQKGKYQTAGPSHKQTYRRTGEELWGIGSLTASGGCHRTAVTKAGNPPALTNTVWSSSLRGSPSHRWEAQATLCSTSSPSGPITFVWETGRAAILDLDRYFPEVQAKKEYSKKKGPLMFKWHLPVPSPAFVRVAKTALSWV